MRTTRSIPAIDEVLELELSELDPDAQDRLIALVERSVDKLCTVGRTLKAGSNVTLTITHG